MNYPQIAQMTQIESVKSAQSADKNSQEDNVPITIYSDKKRLSRELEPGLRLYFRRLANAQKARLLADCDKRHRKDAVAAQQDGIEAQLLWGILGWDDGLYRDEEGTALPYCKESVLIIAREGGVVEINQILLLISGVTPSEQDDAEEARQNAEARSQAAADPLPPPPPEAAT